MVNRMFEFLFKYSRATFERAELVFASGWPVWLLIALIVVAGVFVGVSIWRRQAAIGVFRATALGALQTALLAALLVLVWRPALVTQTLRCEAHHRLPVGELVITGTSRRARREPTPRARAR